MKHERLVPGVRRIEGENLLRQGRAKPPAQKPISKHESPSQRALIIVIPLGNLFCFFAFDRLPLGP